jgi:hypothetical protein
MRLRIDPGGRMVCVYGEAIDLNSLGVVSIRRASRVEPEAGRWWADLAPVGGPRLGPYPRRSEALAAEAAWLDRHLFDLGPGGFVIRDHLFIHDPCSRARPAQS